MVSSKTSLLLMTCVAAAIAGKISAKQQLSSMEEKNSALGFETDKAEKQTFRLERTWQGFPVEDPVEIILEPNHQVKETLIHVHWVQDSEAGYQNTSMSIFLSNDQNMTLRIDLEASTAKASFLWGPNGTWGSEAHSLDPKRDNYIGGGFESNFSTNIWEAQVRFPWDFLPPAVMRIQAIHSTSEVNDYRLLFLPNPPAQNLDLADVNTWAQHFNSQCVVDPIYNAVNSNLEGLNCHCCPSHCCACDCCCLGFRQQRCHRWFNIPFPTFHFPQPLLLQLMGCFEAAKLKHVP